MIRKAMKDVTLNDGTVVPEGTLVHALSYAMHHSDEYYPHPDEFDPFRFSRMREAAGECGSKYQFASTAPDYIPFGHGQHSWYVSRACTFIYVGDPDSRTNVNIVSTALGDSSWRTR